MSTRTVGRQRSRTRRPPAVAIALAAVAVTFFALPILGLLRRAEWSAFWDVLSDPVTRDALRVSLVCSIGATVLATVFGIPLAWVLARMEFPGRRIARAIVILPMIVPPVVGGVALFLAFGRRGIVGQYLDDWFGITLPFTTLGAILAATFVAMPFFVITVEAALRGMDQRYEDAAATLGAGRWTTFRRVTMPLIGPSLAAGAALASGARAGRVRRDDHLRRQPAGRDPDRAPGDLPRLRVGTDRRRHRPQPRARRGVARRARLAP